MALYDDVAAVLAGLEPGEVLSYGEVAWEAGTRRQGQP